MVAEKPDGLSGSKGNFSMLRCCPLWRCSTSEMSGWSGDGWQPSRHAPVSKRSFGEWMPRRSQVVLAETSRRACREADFDGLDQSSIHKTRCSGWSGGRCRREMLAYLIPLRASIVHDHRDCSSRGRQRAS